MTKIRDYDCSYDVKTTIGPDVKKALSLTFPDAYKTAEGMAQIATYIRDRNDSTYCTLPFCHTVEAETMGGDVNFGDENNGPRARNYIVNNLDGLLALPDFDLSSGRISEVLSAIETLKCENNKVLLEISGPLTIMNVLLDAKYVYVGMRKDRETMKRVYEKFTKNLLAYAEEALKKNVDVISFADSSASVSILGPKMIKDYVDDFLFDMIENLSERIMGTATLHLCPKTTLQLIDTGNAVFNTIPLSTPTQYEDAFELVRGSNKILGERCLNQVRSKRKLEQLQSIQLIRRHENE